MATQPAQSPAPALDAPLDLPVLAVAGWDVRLRSPDVRYADSLAASGNHPEVARNLRGRFPQPMTPESARAALDRFTRGPNLNVTLVAVCLSPDPDDDAPQERAIGMLGVASCVH
ncbi:hypothetical protein HK105_201080 [Polyrhizophydium stewartii]|uniref:Uncharacterized protein n=1 Tax=Polyrhizophydium stewartii TaxID=2732419 RepID=A0ABR4NIT8_9FUNG